MKVNCSCGFLGTLRPIKSSLGTVAKCYGCDKLYEEKDGEVMEVSEIPQFASWEEMNKFLESVPKGSKATTGKKRSQAKKKSTVKPDPAKKLVTAQSVEQVEVYQTIHFYLRKSDEFVNVLKDAREEKKIRHETILVFAHNHSISDPCSNLCREVVK